MLKIGIFGKNKKKEKDFVVENGTLVKCNTENKKEVEIPDNVKYISSGLMSKNTDLVSVKIPDSVTAIGDSAFWGCKNLTCAELPENLTELGESVFFGCENLISVHIPKNLHKLKRAVFYRCKQLESAVIPENMEVIGESAFYSCESFKKIIIPQNVTSIEVSAFAKCKNLTSLTLSDNIIFIGADAFSGCDKLCNVVIPDSVIQNAHIQDAFDKRNDLDLIIFGKKIPSTASVADMARIIQRFDFDIDVPIEVKYPLIVAFYNKTSDIIAYRYILQNIIEFVKGLTLIGDADYIREFTDKLWIPKEDIDECINFAIEKKQNQIYILLLRYKKEQFGFQETEGRFDF